MAMLMVASVILAGFGVVLGVYPTGPGFPSFPGGDPSHQQQNGLSGGFQSDHCVTSTRTCPCPTVYFPLKNCHYCACLTNHQTSPSPIPASSPTVQSSTTTSGALSSSTITTSQPMTTFVTSFVTDYCLVAKNLCGSNCPGGYLVDPNDCTFCLCKKDLITG